MKKFNDPKTGLFVLLATCLSLSSCDNDRDDVPKDYVGFEHPTETIECSKDQTERELQIKIIAGDKADEDRTVQLKVSPPPTGQSPIITLTESKVTVKSGKKSVTTTIKVYPQRMLLKQQNVIVYCTPQWKEGKASQLSILVKRK